MESSRKQFMVSGVMAKGIYQKVTILWNGQRREYHALTGREYRELIDRLGMLAQKGGTDHE